MNKRFSTLLAAALVAGGLSVTAQTAVTIANGSVTGGAANKATTYTAGKYYHLSVVAADAATGLLSLEKNYDGKKDSLITIALDTDGTGRLEEFANSPEFKARQMAQVDSTLWQFNVKNATAVIKTYEFVNKATGLKLSLDPKVTNAHLSTAEGAISEWAWDGAALVSGGYALDVASSAGAKVTFKKGGANTLTAYEPALIKMTAADLNAYGGDWFELSVSDAIVSGSDANLSKVKFQAIQARNHDAAASPNQGGVVMDGVYLKAVGKEVEATNVADGTKKIKNKNVFLALDTVAHAGISFDTKVGIGLKFALDTLPQNTTTTGDSIGYANRKDGTLGSTAAVDYNALLKEAFTYGRDSVVFQYYFFRNPAVEGSDGLIGLAGGVQVTMKTKAQGGYACAGSAVGETSTAGTGAYIALYGSTGATPVVTLYPISTTSDIKVANMQLGAGTKADVAEGLYYMAYYTASSSHADKKAVSEKFATSILNAATPSWSESTASAPMMNDKVTYGDDNTVSPLVPATQWRVKKTVGGYTIANREIAALTKTKTIYTTTIKNVYKFGGDSIILVAVNNDKAKDKYVGYKHFTDDELKNAAVVLKFNNPLGNDSYVYVKNDSVLAAKAMEDYAATATYFTMEPAAGGAYKFDGDNAERQAYLLKKRFDTSAKVVGFSNGTTNVNKENVKLTSFRGTPAYSASTYSTSDSIAVLFRETLKEGEYEVIMIEGKLDANNKQSFPIDALYSTNNTENIISVSGTSMGLIKTKHASNQAGTFSVIVPQALRYVDVVKGSPKHGRIYSAANTSLAITVSDKKVGVLKSTTDLKSDAYAEDNFKLFIDTADMTKPEMPKFYIRTNQVADLTAEEVADGQSYYMAANGDANGIAFKKAKQFGATRDTLIEMRPATLTKPANDTLNIKKVNVSELFVFQATSEEGVYNIKNVASGKYLNQNNGILTLAEGSALAFSLNTAIKAPVGNETIDATAVQVIASEGAVTVIGAAGKQVTVSDVLGRVAIVQITADSQTIAVAPGVAIVAVEGEAAVKAIVR